MMEDAMPTNRYSELRKDNVTAMNIALEKHEKIEVPPGKFRCVASDAFFGRTVRIGGNEYIGRDYDLFTDALGHAKNLESDEPVTIFIFDSDGTCLYNEPAWRKLRPLYGNV
jgi:hypothetical protein